ncbi:nuclear transport factor 2 family protein [Sandaracinomonas limnophila]|uniref:Nuclear transport factor 2 family protein n=2 Tax=Sandaracinomonas limnophila TaxID=1862386 RepID=A0A437PUM0_9BACT|nr:nuclear transport factor 2 family protein [Sandaracinomonas limnophila]
MKRPQLKDHKIIQFYIYCKAQKQRTMKHVKKIALFIFIFSTSVFAKIQPSKESLKAAELDRFKVMIAADKAGLEKSLHKDLYYCHSSATIDNKESYIESIVSKKTIYHKIEVEESMQRVYGNTGINTGILNVTNLKDGVEQPVNRIRYTGVYIFEDGRWQMVSWQTTKSPK